VFEGQFEESLLGSSQVIGEGGHSGTVNPTEALPLNSSRGIVITIFRSSPGASGGLGGLGGVSEERFSSCGHRRRASSIPTRRGCSHGHDEVAGSRFEVDR